MDRMHKKSALPATSRLLVAASQVGADLAWERYERQLPLCGFTSNGLNCRKCFEGPCRINPFGDEPRRGVCGADRDQIAMESLFQATLDGVLAVARSEAALGLAPGGDDLSGALPAVAAERLASAGLLPVRRSDLAGILNPYFSHKAYLPETVKALTRLGLIHHGILSATASAMPVPAPVVAHDGATLLVAGQPSAALAQALAEIGAASVRVVSQGGGHGSSELALLAGADALLLAPDAARPGLPEMAERLGIPVVLVRDATSVRQTAEEAIAQARRQAARSPRPPAEPGAAVGSRFPRPDALQRALRRGRISGVIVLAGEPTVKQTFFERTLALVAACVGQRVLVLVGGDLGAAVDGLTVELDKRHPGLLASFAPELAAEGLAPIAAFGSLAQLPRVIALLDGAAPVVAAFPEFFRTATWASAVSLLSLGFTVQLGIRLPFWGSPALVPVLAGEWGKLTGGRLLAGPALAEPAAQAEELLAALKAGGGRQGD